MSRCSVTSNRAPRPSSPAAKRKGISLTPLATQMLHDMQLAGLSDRSKRSTVPLLVLVVVLRRRPSSSSFVLVVVLRPRRRPRRGIADEEEEEEEEDEDEKVTPRTRSDRLA